MRGCQERPPFDVVVPTDRSGAVAKVRIPVSSPLNRTEPQTGTASHVAEILHPLGRGKTPTYAGRVHLWGTTLDPDDQCCAAVRGDQYDLITGI